MNLQDFLSVRSSKARTLDHIRALYRQLGNPQDSMLCVQVAGTNAKGSTSAMLSMILRKAGYKTGLYTSPALSKANERMRTDGVMISDEELLECALLVEAAEQALGRTFGGFDRMTACALLAYQKQNVQVAVLETGLGGLLDPVTAVDARLNFITSISMDHMQILGNTIEEIANQKCGSLKPGVPVISHPQVPSVERLIALYAEALGCPLTVVNPEDIHDVEVGEGLQTMSYHGYRVAMQLLGPHQRVNAAAAIEGALALRAQGLAISDEHIVDGLAATHWSCRLEMVKGFLLDGAHNEDAMRVLRASLAECYPNKRPILMLAVMQDKDIAGIAKVVATFVHECVCVKINERSADAEALAGLLRERGVSAVPAGSVTEGLKLLNDMRNGDTIAVVAGSLYLTGAVKDILLSDS
ncbi:MAG: bifunctional folylpolyglutamate synthase/dihydrofolate synthase [Bacillota bacterium]